MPPPPTGRGHNNSQRADLHGRADVGPGQIPGQMEGNIMPPLQAVLDIVCRGIKNYIQHVIPSSL